MLVILVGLALFAGGFWGVIYGQVGPLQGRGKAALATVAGLVAFFVGVGIMAENASQEAKTTAKTSASPSQAKINPDVPAATPNTNQTTTNAQQTASPSKKEPVIPGLMPADISLNLNKIPYNLKFGDFKKGVTRYQKCGKRDVGGETMEVCIDSTDINDVVFIDATVWGTGVTSANLLLPFVATVPFDGNEPQKAKAWVTDNLPKLKEGQPVETTFGGVKFILFGNGKTNANLQLTPAK